MAAWTIRARWVFPVSGPPLEGGTVTVEDDWIAAVNLPEKHIDFDVGNAAILPGFVNAHTHLDLGGLRGLAPPSPDFTGWLRQVIAHRRARSLAQVSADIRGGVAESLRAGVTLLGDISGDGSSWDVLTGASLRAVVFRELLGLPLERAEVACPGLANWLKRLQPSPTCRPGVSPHAPYSVRSSLFFTATSWELPVAIHLAESAEELELLMLRRGPFVNFLKDLGVWDPKGLVEDPEHVLRLTNALVPVLYIHGNYLRPEAPVPKNGSLVYCPRTHAAFGHPPHPFRDFLTRGIRVALGTDSLASNPDLDLLAEARFLHRLYPDLPGDVLLRMATLSGAEALGWAGETGSLEVGKSADLVVLPLTEREGADPHSLLFASTLPVRAVLFRGRWLFDREGILAPSE